MILALFCTLTYPPSRLSDFNTASYAHRSHTRLRNFRKPRHPETRLHHYRQGHHLCSEADAQDSSCKRAYLSDKPTQEPKSVSSESLPQYINRTVPNVEYRGSVRCRAADRREVPTGVGGNGFECHYLCSAICRAVQARNGRWLRCVGRFSISKADDCPRMLNILHDPFQAVWYVKIAIK